MAEEQEEQIEEENLEDEGIFLAWDVPEYIQHDRSWRWYVVAGIIGVALVLWAIFTANFLFAIIVVMAGIIMFLTSQREPGRVPFAITVGGIVIGDHFHPYHEFRHFSVLYAPPEVKRLYLVSDGRLRPTITISLEEMDPNIVRETLLDFLPEDLARVEESLTEMISRVYKL